MPTKIEWCDETWNPIRGCRNRCWADDAHPEGNCYAACMSRRHLTQRSDACCPRCDDFLDVHAHDDRLRWPLRWRKPRWVFAGSMTDLFGDKAFEGSSDEAVHLRETRRQMWRTMALCPQHTFVVLTKRPQRVDFVEMQVEGERARCGSWDGSNLIVGTTVPAPVDLHRLDDLRDRFAERARFDTFRPTLLACFEPLTSIHGWHALDVEMPEDLLRGYGWVVVGLATGLLRSRVFPPAAAHAALGTIGNAAVERGIPLFVKDNATDWAPNNVRWHQDHPQRANHP